MSDDKSQSQGQDRQRINIHQDYELRDWAESRAGLASHTAREVRPGTPAARDKRALERPARPARRVCRVAMPCRSVEDEQRASTAARQHLPATFVLRI